MKLYLDFVSEPSKAVYYFLKINNIEFETNIVDLLKGENRLPEYEKINPFRLVPAIDDDGFILTESIAILRYLATKYNAAEHWFPKDVQKQARVDEFLNWYHTNLRKNSVELYMYRLFTTLDVPTLPKFPHDEEKLKKLQADVAKSIKNIDTYFLKDKPFLCGDVISAADLMGFCELESHDIIGEEIAKSNKNVNAWMKRVGSYLEKFSAEPRAAMDTLKTLYDNSKKINGSYIHL